MNKTFTTNNVNNLYTVLDIITDHVPSDSDITVTFDNNYSYNATRITIDVPTDDNESDYESFVKYYVYLPCEILNFTNDSIKYSAYSLQDLIDLLEDDYDTKLLKHYDESIKELTIQGFAEYNPHSSGCIARYQNSEDYLKDVESITVALCSFFNKSFNIRSVGCSIFIDANAQCCIADLRTFEDSDSNKDLKLDGNYYLHNVLRSGTYYSNACYIGSEVFNK